VLVSGPASAVPTPPNPTSSSSVDLASMLTRRTPSAGTGGPPSHRLYQQKARPPTTAAQRAAGALLSLR